MARWKGLLLAITTLLCSAASAQSISVVDDNGHTVTLAGPAQRIVSLAPSLTELLFVAGAGNRIVGVSEYSDYPPQAQGIPIVGRYDLLRHTCWHRGNWPGRLKILPRTTRNLAQSLSGQREGVCVLSGMEPAPNQRGRQRINQRHHHPVRWQQYLH